ncbi:50S ribosomal protein L29 [Taibaiella chishuiensis]|uniref:Large ribosomal subunit protein uL29 n=1 Tax=Taibaiella chishuiensis TaxID=1434707 RepID=A0A2P8DC91_9BACT|nr:50S ribosomal protein L29 [Taibaiella chishuiensis]PSK94830.1 large subunit ribosomal protein L29 [Taibaiella chishuiensis]
MAKSTKADVQDYRSFSDEALSDKIGEETLRLKKLKFSHAVNPIENPMVIRSIRRQIAQMKTEQHKRQLAS